MAATSVHRPPDGRARLLAELAAVRDDLRGPDGSDPALSDPLGPEDDAVEMCAAVYALPDQFRELGSTTGMPLMWAWPARLFRGHMVRREQLLLAAALALAAVERLDIAAARRRRLLQLVPEVGQE